MRAFAGPLLAAALLFCGAAHADDTPPKRARPDYDGRGEEKPSVGDDLLWAPRIVVAPIYFVTEYVIRKPINALGKHAEKHEWPRKLRDFFTWGPEHKAGIVPTAYYEFGFSPSVGAYLFWDDFVKDGNDFRAQAATWGSNWLTAHGIDRYKIGKDSYFMVRGGWTLRPDGLYSGLGPRAREADIVRYGYTQIDAAPGVDLQMFGASRFRAWVGLRSMRFRDDRSCCGDPELRESTLPAPPGFDGYTAVFERAELVLDSRVETKTGVRLLLEGEHGSDFKSEEREWIRYGAHLGGFVDFGKARVLGLMVSALFADPLRGEVPFTEQVVLGGFGLMRGYKPGRLVDRSALVATLLYEWPVWVWVNGTAQVAVGNVFGTHLDEFDLNLLRVTSGIGLRTTSSPDHQLELLFGFGTETYESGMNITSVRLYLGGTFGF